MKINIIMFHLNSQRTVQFDTGTTLVTSGIISIKLPVFSARVLTHFFE